MHRPVAAQFQGSFPPEEIADIRLVHLLDLAFGGLAIMLAGTVWAAAYTLTSAPDLPSVLKASCLMLLAPALVGLWLMRQTEHAPQLILAGIYDAVFRRLAQTGPLATSHVADGSSYRGVAGVLYDMAVLNRRQHAGREQASDLASQISDEATALAGVAALVDEAGVRLAGEIAAVQQSFDMSDGAVARAVDMATGVAASVRATTASAETLTVMASRLALVGHDTQKWAADLEGRTAQLGVALDQIGRGLKVARALGRSAEAAQAGFADGGDPGGGELQAMASLTQGALAGCLDLVQEMAAETGQASRRVAEISELVRSNHEIGEAIGQSVAQQGEDISRILEELYAARTGFATLKAGVDAVTRVGTERGTTAQSLRHTARRLPTHANTMANILRGSSDPRPPTPV